MFILKTTVTLPLLFLIAFCVRQYGREREHEETYAFKAAISFSLAPYIHLISDMHEKDAGEHEVHFVVDAIGKIFDRPATDRANRRVEKDRPPSQAEVLEMIRTLLETLKK